MLRLGLWRLPFVVGWRTCRAFLAMVDAVGASDADILAKDEDLRSGDFYTLEVGLSSSRMLVR
jgi:hypothetical protein